MAEEEDYKSIIIPKVSPGHAAQQRARPEPEPEPELELGPPPAPLEKADEPEEEPMIARVTGIELQGGAYGTVYSDKCPVCMSEHRVLAEEMFEGGAHIQKVKAVFDSRGVKIPLQAVRHHFSQHYKSAEKLMRQIEYSDRISAAVLKRRKNCADDLEMILAICRIELGNAIGMETSPDPSKEKDRNDIIMKITSRMMDALEQLRIIDGDNARAESMSRQFVSVFKRRIEISKTEVEREMWISAFREFGQAMQMHSGLPEPKQE